MKYVLPLFVLVIILNTLTFISFILHETHIFVDKSKVALPLLLHL